MSFQDLPAVAARTPETDPGLAQHIQYFLQIRLGVYYLSRLPVYRIKEQSQQRDPLIEPGRPGPGPHRFHFPAGEDVLGPIVRLILLKQIIIHRKALTAICGSDMHIMEWDDWSKIYIKPPVIPGHETAGEIIAVGSRVTNRKVGDRVSCESHIACGKCWFCQNDLAHICKNLVLFGCGVDGAFAEYTKIPAHATYLLPDNISYEEACMFEPMGAGVHGAEAAEPEGKTVLIFGCGPIGLTAISACKTFGAKQVIAVDLLDEKLDIAREMGADYTFNSVKCDLTAEIMMLTDGIGADAVIDITGAAPAIHSAFRCVRAAGKVVSVGLPGKPIALDLTNDIAYREVVYTGISGRKIWQTWENFSKVMSGPYFKLQHVMGGKYLLEDFDKAVADIEQGIPGKKLIYPNAEDMSR